MTNCYLICVIIQTLEVCQMVEVEMFDEFLRKYQTHNIYWGKCVFSDVDGWNIVLSNYLCVILLKYVTINRHASLPRLPTVTV